MIETNYISAGTMWQKLEWRLRAIANDRQDKYSNTSKCCVIRLRLFQSKEGRLLGWTKPLISPIEPKLLDIDHVPIRIRTLHWYNVVEEIKTMRDVELVVYEGRPYGIL